MTTKEIERVSHAEQNAEAWSDSITAAHEAYAFCCQDLGLEGRDISAEAKAVLKAHAYDGTNHDLVGEWIIDAMREAPLSVEIRSGWYDPSCGPAIPEEFCILLSTGGPALRVMGGLNEYAEPSRCWLEHQDWGTPWTRYFSRTEGRADALRWFASLFYYGG